MAKARCRYPCGGAAAVVLLVGDKPNTDAGGCLGRGLELLERTTRGEYLVPRWGNPGVGRNSYVIYLDDSVNNSCVPSFFHQDNGMEADLVKRVCPSTCAEMRETIGMVRKI